MFFRRREAVQDYDLENIKVRLVVTEKESLEQLHLIKLTEEVLLTLKQMERLITGHIPKAVRSFYDSIMGNLSLVEIINTNSSRERLEKTLIAHIADWFRGVIDDEYIKKRKKIAKIHVHIGLEPKWYLAACHNLQNNLVKYILLENLPKEQEIAFVESISKIMSYEQQLVLEEYDRYAAEQANEKEEAIKRKFKDTLGSIVTLLENQSSETTASVEELIALTKEVNEEVSDGIKTSLQTIETAEKGKRIVQSLTENSKEIYDKTSSMSGMIEKLNQSSVEILHVVTIVKEIATKTNLLAINSAIEAARAGEHGKGFSVVANEVRKLAEQTKSSVEQIDALVGESTESQRDVVQTIMIIQQLANLGLLESEQTEQAFSSISKMIQEVSADSKAVGSEINNIMIAVEIIGDASIQILESAKLLDETIRKI